MNGKHPTTHHKKILSKGVMAALFPLVIIFVMGFSAIVVDVGIMRVQRAQLQNLTESAALAATNVLFVPGGTYKSNGSDVISAAQSIADKNKILGNPVLQNLTVTIGKWDTYSNTFIQVSPSSGTATAVSVSAEITPSFYFGNLLGLSSQNFKIAANSHAALLYPERDIMFLIDVGPLMRFYALMSTYSPVASSFQKSMIDKYLSSIYSVLQLPQLGNMIWPGVKIVYGGNASTTPNDYIISQLGLTNVPYPFPVGSWDEYASYGKTLTLTESSGWTQPYLNLYGYETFIEYLIDIRPKVSETPILWQAPIEPLQQTKQSVRDFAQTNLTALDRVALMTCSGNSIVNVDQTFTKDNFSIYPILLHYQPAHYTLAATAPVPALQRAVDEVHATSRSSAKKIIYFIIPRLNYDASILVDIPGLTAVANDAKSKNIIINIIFFGWYIPTPGINAIASITGGSAAQAYKTYPSNFRLLLKTMLDKAAPPTPQIVQTSSS